MKDRGRKHKMRLLRGAFLLTLATVLVIALIDVTPVDEPSTVAAVACVAAGLAAIVLGLAGLVAWTRAITALNLWDIAAPATLALLCLGGLLLGVGKLWQPNRANTLIAQAREEVPEVPEEILRRFAEPDQGNLRLATDYDRIQVKFEEIEALDALWRGDSAGRLVGAPPALEAVEIRPAKTHDWGSAIIDPAWKDMKKVTPSAYIKLGSIPDSLYHTKAEPTVEQTIIYPVIAGRKKFRNVETEMDRNLTIYFVTPAEREAIDAVFAPPSTLSILLGAVCLILFPLSVYRLGVAVKKRWKKRKA